MRIHLGHHFYGAGNLGDDFMLAGFLLAIKQLVPNATITGSVPFPLEPLQARFGEIEWHPYTANDRKACIEACDAWVGVGGSPFQSAQSRWFVDHLTEDAALCGRSQKPMYFLGVGVQTTQELRDGAVRQIIDQARAIWTRDQASASRLAQQSAAPRIEAASDLAHLFFRAIRPPEPQLARATIVANFDYGTWPGMASAVGAIDKLSPADRVWLAQEARELPGAERMLFASLPIEQQRKWRLVIPDEPPANTAKMPRTDRGSRSPAAGHSTSVAAALGRWPTGEWLLTARFHAALAGAWAGSRVVVIATNEKLRAAAAEIGTRAIAADADADAALQALQQATPAAPPIAHAEQAYAACRDLVGMIESRR